MIENKLPSTGFEALYAWMKQHQDLFPGGILTDFEIPVRSPFCILEVPRKDRIIEQNLSGFWQVKRYDCGLQIGIQNRDLWGASLLAMDIVAMLNERMTMNTDSNIVEFSILETEYFLFDQDAFKNKALLFGTRIHFTADLQLSIANPESAYENLQMRIMEFNKSSVIAAETIPITKESDDE